VGDTHSMANRYFSERLFGMMNAPYREVMILPESL
jgi:hypothetical protein